jgi:hypothetical protein
MRFRHEVDLDATPAKVFAIFDDESSWPKWFHAIHKVEWTSPRPHGVDSTRTVTLATATIFEHFFRWEQDRRCSFYLTGASSRWPTRWPRTTCWRRSRRQDALHLPCGIEPACGRGGRSAVAMYFDSMFKSACEHLRTMSES